MNTSTLVQKLWNYCNVLRDDGMSYGDYVEQLTYLLFLKMADERSWPPYSQWSLIPAHYAWPSLLARIYDLRTNKHFTLKTNPLKREDLDEFVARYNPANRHDRKPTWSDGRSPRPRPLPEGDRTVRMARHREREGIGTEGRWRCYEYDELIARDKASLDIFWLKDKSLADSDNLPPAEVIAQEIVDDLEAALEQFRLIAEDLNDKDVGGKAKWREEVDSSTT